MATFVVAYLAWKVTESPSQSVQFAFNGLSVGAVYALLAMGFTLVYSTVWFFDLYYGAAAALGAYGVFYLRSKEAIGGLYQVQNPVVNALFAAVVAGVVAWALYEILWPRLRDRVSQRRMYGIAGAAGAAAGVYAGFVFTFTDNLHVLFGPLAGLAIGAVAGLAVREALVRLTGNDSRLSTYVPIAVGLAGGIVAAAYFAGAPETKLYLSWAVSCLLAGCVGLGLYRGLYVTLRQRARSPLVMLVASMGILLAISAAITIVFESAPRPLPDAFGSEPLKLGGGNIKGFNFFTVGVSLVGFTGLLWLLQRTSFGRTVRAIGDDEDVSKVVGINTTVVIAIVFFIGAVFAAMAGILSGHDTAIQPRMGLLLLLKGWIASVVGGIGNLYGALIGGFALGMVEQFGIWDLAGEWKDVISFVVLILFLSFWPRGLLPRK
ncbi:MAG: branched-chain amino acid ABC transporter permease [Chloroflexi bacterium]|nr:branched-chain amino acid ABC transporter permease [Chloroflexota bacterium]